MAAFYSYTGWFSIFVHLIMPKDFFFKQLLGFSPNLQIFALLSPKITYGLFFPLALAFIIYDTRYPIWILKMAEANFGNIDLNDQCAIS